MSLQGARPAHACASPLFRIEAVIAHAENAAFDPHFDAGDRADDGIVAVAVEIIAVGCLAIACVENGAVHKRAATKSWL